jgi:hypothetical protein
MTSQTLFHVNPVCGGQAWQGAGPGGEAWTTPVTQQKTSREEGHPGTLPTEQHVPSLFCL